MDKVNANRADMGAVINRLTHAIDNLSNVSTNQSASRSRIMDADYAKASTELPVVKFFNRLEPLFWLRLMQVSRLCCNC